jgi:peptidoglycan/LPS O-acetylase OafA/YrhL
MIITYLRNHVTNLSDWFLQLTLFKGFYDSVKFYGIAQSWSLTVEMVFYIMAPFLLFYLKNTNKNKIFYVLIGTYLIGIILVILGKFFNSGMFSTFELMLLYTFFGRCFEFYIGVYLAIMVKNNDLAFRRINK